jgi:hypothetical protein
MREENEIKTYRIVYTIERYRNDIQKKVERRDRKIDEI